MFLKVIEIRQIVVDLLKTYTDWTVKRGMYIKVFENSSNCRRSTKKYLYRMDGKKCHLKVKSVLYSSSCCRSILCKPKTQNITVSLPLKSDIIYLCLFMKKDLENVWISLVYAIRFKNKNEKDFAP